MSTITYPTTLPAPSRWAGVPLERRAVSSLPGNTQHRARSRDALQDIEAQWFYTAPEMAIWREWYEQTLHNGMFWFAATSPGAGGWVARVFRHRTKSIKCELLGNGVYTVSAQLQQRGLSAAPRDPMAWSGTDQSASTWVLTNTNRTAAGTHPGVIEIKAIRTTDRGAPGQGTGIVGKWYWEIAIDQLPSPQASISYSVVRASQFIESLGTPYWVVAGNSAISSAGGVAAGGGFPALAGGGYLMFAFDAAIGRLWVGVNDVWTNGGDPDAGTGWRYTFATPGDFKPALQLDRFGGASTYINTINCGPGNFRNPTPPLTFLGLGS